MEHACTKFWYGIARRFGRYQVQVQTLGSGITQGQFADTYMHLNARMTA